MYIFLDVIAIISNVGEVEENVKKTNNKAHKRRNIQLMDDTNNMVIIKVIKNIHFYKQLLYIIFD